MVITLSQFFSTFPLKMFTNKVLILLNYFENFIFFISNIVLNSVNFLFSLVHEYMILCILNLFCLTFATLKF